MQTSEERLTTYGSVSAELIRELSIRREPCMEEGLVVLEEVFGGLVKVREMDGIEDEEGGFVCGCVERQGVGDNKE